MTLGAITGVLVVGASTARAGGGACVAEFTGDCSLDATDVLAFVAAFNAGDPIANIVPDGALDWTDVYAYLFAFSVGCTFDADGDRLPDCAETNTGVYVSPDDTGTDPSNPDTDNDGLRDGDEVLGTTSGLDLPAFGVSPVRRDILVETDWFSGVFEGQFRNFRPTDQALLLIEQCFASAPLPNPDGTTGVSMHIDRGQGGAFTGGEQLPGTPVFILFDADFNEYKAEHFDPRRKGYFHYCIFANRYGNSNNGSSGFAEINGDDFTVTLSNYFSSYNAAATFVHELGHNLNLRHGGFENRNYKPNFNSVMNYRYQFAGADTDGDLYGDGLIDYSSGTYLPIDESSIDEKVGVLGSPLDLNYNGIIEPVPYAANINCAYFTAECGSNGGGECGDTVCTTISDSDDWSRINWQRLSVSPDRLPSSSRETVECDNWPGR